MTKKNILMFLYLGGAFYLQGTVAHINNNSRVDNTYHKHTITFPVITLFFKAGYQIWLTHTIAHASVKSGERNTAHLNLVRFFIHSIFFYV